jgi:hypothetical protein
MAELGGHEGESEDMPIAWRIIQAFLPPFKTLILLSIKLLAKAIGNVVMGLDNPSSLHVFGEGLHMVRS